MEESGIAAPYSHGTPPSKCVSVAYGRSVPPMPPPTQTSSAMLIIKHHNPSTAYRGRTWRLLGQHGNGTEYNPWDFSTIRLSRPQAGPSHF